MKTELDPDGFAAAIHERDAARADARQARSDLTEVMEQADTARAEVEQWKASQEKWRRDCGTAIRSNAELAAEVEGLRTDVRIAIEMRDTRQREVGVLVDENERLRGLVEDARDQLCYCSYDGRCKWCKALGEED